MAAGPGRRSAGGRKTMDVSRARACAAERVRDGGTEAAAAAGGQHAIPVISATPSTCLIAARRERPVRARRRGEDRPARRSRLAYGLDGRGVVVRPRAWSRSTLPPVRSRFPDGRRRPRGTPPAWTSSGSSASTIRTDVVGSNCGGGARVPRTSRGCRCTRRPAAAAAAAISGAKCSIHSNDSGSFSSRCLARPP